MGSTLSEDASADEGEGEKIVGAYAPYTPLSTRLQGIGTQNNARRAISKMPAAQ